MRYPKSIIGCLVLIVVLGAAASAPERTYDVLVKSRQMHKDSQTEKRRNASLDTWRERLEQAHAGDVGAMSRVGRRMLIPSRESWTGFKQDSVQAGQFLRRASAAGDPHAKLAVWKLDGATNADLADVAVDILGGEVDIEILVRLWAALGTATLRDCDETLLDGLHLVQDRLVKYDPQREHIMREHRAEYDAVFAAECEG